MSKTFYFCKVINIYRILKKKFVTNLAFLLFLNLLIKPFYVLGIDVGIQNSVTTASYGLYFPLLSLTLMFQVVLDMGIENFTRCEIARDHQQLPAFFSGIVVLKIVLALIYFGICLLIGIISDYNMLQLKLLFILLINQFIASFTLYLRANIGGLQLFKTESIISVLDKTLLVIICSSLLWGRITDKPFRIEWFVYAQSFSYVVTFVVSLLILLTRKNNFFRLQFNLNGLLSIIKRSLPYAILVLLMGAYYRIDPVLLERILPDGKTEAGIYAHSFRLLDMLQNYGYLFALILLPMFSRMLKNNEPVEQLVNISFIIIIVPALILSVGSVFYRTEIIDLLYDEHLEVSAKVFGIIMPGFTGICASYIFGTLLTANGNLKILILISALGALISIVINLLLIPLIGVTGSAIANVSAQFFTSAVQLFIAVKVFKFRFNYRLVIQLLIYLSVIIFIAILSKMVRLNWFYQAGIYSLLALTMIPAVRIIRIKTLMVFLGLVRN